MSERKRESEPLCAVDGRAILDPNRSRIRNQTPVFVVDNVNSVRCGGQQGEGRQGLAELDERSFDQLEGLPERLIEP